MEDNRKKVLLVGQNPDCFSGNGNMLGACLEDVDPNKYNVCAFLKDEVPISMITDPFNYQSTIQCPTINAREQNDPWGKQKLLNLLENFDFDIVVFVGIDIWRYVDCFEDIDRIRTRKEFIVKMLLPYDLDHIREDWMMWFNFANQIYVYSEYGYEKVQDYVPSANYYRPKLRFSDSYYPLEREEKHEVRKLIFPDTDDETFIFGYVGNNMIRKNIYSMIRGFARILKSNQNVVLYMHLNNVNEPYGIERIKNDLNIPDFNLRHNGNTRKLLPHEMSVVWNTFDCHVIPSFYEGLSWTVIESKLTGIPSILSYNTAHEDFVNMVDEMSEMSEIKQRDNVLIPIMPDQEETVPLITNYGPGYIYSNSCSQILISEAFNKALSLNLKDNDDVISDCVALGQKWIGGCHDFQTDILDDEPIKGSEQKSYGEMV